MGTSHPRRQDVVKASSRHDARDVGSSAVSRGLPPRAVNVLTRRASARRDPAEELAAIVINELAGAGREDRRLASARKAFAQATGEAAIDSYALAWTVARNLDSSRGKDGN
jgi:hypothetical protein